MKTLIVSHKNCMDGLNTTVFKYGGNSELRTINLYNIIEKEIKCLHL
jgi:hypothetical protein